MTGPSPDRRERLKKILLEASELSDEARTLYLDLACAGDPELRREVLLVMKQLAVDGMTMLVVTHEMGFARNVGSRVVLMDEGVVVEDSPPERFFVNPDTARAKRFLQLFEE